ELHVQRRSRTRTDGPRQDGRGEATGVVGYRLIREVDDGEQAAVLAEVDVEPARQQLVLVRALGTVTVQLLVRDADEVVEPLGLAAELQLRFLEAVAARRDAEI